MFRLSNRKRGHVLQSEREFISVCNGELNIANMEIILKIKYVVGILLLVW